MNVGDTLQQRLQNKREIVTTNKCEVALCNFYLFMGNSCIHSFHFSTQMHNKAGMNSIARV